MIILFVNIKLLIDSCLSKGFPGQLHEALPKCTGMILDLNVYVRVAQSVEYVTTYDKLFYLWASRVRVPLCTFIFSFVSFFQIISLSFITLCFILILVSNSLTFYKFYQYSLIYKINLLFFHLKICMHILNEIYVSGCQLSSTHRTILSCT